MVAIAAALAAVVAHVDRRRWRLLLRSEKVVSTRDGAASSSARSHLSMRFVLKAQARRPSTSIHSRVECGDCRTGTLTRRSTTFPLNDYLDRSVDDLHRYGASVSGTALLRRGDGRNLSTTSGRVCEMARTPPPGTSRIGSSAPVCDGLWGWSTPTATTWTRRAPAPRHRRCGLSVWAARVAGRSVASPRHRPGAGTNGPSR